MSQNGGSASQQVVESPLSNRAFNGLSPCVATRIFVRARLQPCLNRAFNTALAAGGMNFDVVTWTSTA